LSITLARNIKVIIMKALIREALILLKEETMEQIEYSEQRSRESSRTHYADDVKRYNKKLIKIKELLKA